MIMNLRPQKVDYARVELSIGFEDLCFGPGYSVIPRMHISQVQILTTHPRTDSLSIIETAITKGLPSRQLAIVGSDKACIDLKEVNTPKYGSEETCVMVPVGAHTPTDWCVFAPLPSCAPC